MYQEHKNMYIPWPVIFSWILRGEILNTEKLYKQKCSWKCYFNSKKWEAVIASVCQLFLPIDVTIKMIMNINS